MKVKFLPSERLYSQYGESELEVLEETSDYYYIMHNNTRCGFLKRRFSIVHDVSGPKKVRYTTFKNTKVIPCDKIRHPS